MVKINRTLVILTILACYSSTISCKIITHRVRSNDEKSSRVENSVAGDDRNSSENEIITFLTEVESTMSDFNTTEINNSTSRLFNHDSFGNVRTLVHGLKRNLKKAFKTIGYFGPEIGLCSCLVKFAWYTYPIVPEITYSAIGRAKSAFGGFIQDFMEGFHESQYQHHYSEQRISNNIVSSGLDDYVDYQSRVNADKYNVLRRNGELPQQQQDFQQADPKVVLLADFLKNLKPKGVPVARSLNFTRENVTSQGRNFQPSAQRKVLVSGKPSGLPGFNELPPADYTYFKNGVYHHVHDLRSKSKSKHKRGLWSNDFEDRILSAFGLLPPGKSLTIVPKLDACAKNYALAIVFRHLQYLLFK